MTLTARPASQPRRRRLGAVIAVVAVAAATVVTSSASSAALAGSRSTPHLVIGSSGQARPHALVPVDGTVHWAVTRPVCAAPAAVGVARCFAVRRIEVAKGTPGATSYVVPDRVKLGPAGGYTPANLASAYRYDPDRNRRGQLVAIVDWFDDPNALSDLNHFDRHYGLPVETSRSFRKVNQQGRTSPLPKRDRASAGEIALDIEAVRGVCHTCRILLIEADGPTERDLAAAENLAVDMGATEISNSFGETEHRIASRIANAYNHPGVVITASTGDDGWYSWDGVNQNIASADNAAFPSTSPNVVAVSGTSLVLTGQGARKNEYVWNENGASDEDGLNSGAARGAAGGGCSRVFDAPQWQKHYRGYAAAGCDGKRLGADISALADSHYGYDTYDTYGSNGWGTVGGTSLSSPVVAAMYALAGGSGRSAYPAASLYVNGTYRPRSKFDVITGGNGFCGGDDTESCRQFTYNHTDPPTHNPNGVGAGLLDCSFRYSGKDVSTAPPKKSECNATAGYDGASGLGAPNGILSFGHTNAGVAIALPKHRVVGSQLTFAARIHQILPHTYARRFIWHFSDGGSSDSKYPKVHHTYRRAGRYGVRLLVIDNRYQEVFVQGYITVR